MRSGDGFSRADLMLDGSVELGGVSGRSVELSGEFTVTGGRCGFTLLDDGTSSLKVYYDGATNEMVVDARGLDRLINDTGVFDGYYHSVLPRQLAKGSDIKLHVFYDHSILDIFVNDTWATSVRVFPKAKAVEGITAFADAPTQVKALKAWNLDVRSMGSGLGSVIAEAPRFDISVEAGCIRYSNVDDPAILTVYNLSGQKMVERYIDSSEGSIETSLSGVHIVALRTPDSTSAGKMMF